LKYIEVELSNGEKTKVRRLGLFEIDEVPKEIPGPFTYTVHLLGGGEHKIVYDFDDAIKNPPAKPSIRLEEAIEGSPEYYQWQDWLRYQEALAHQSKMYEAYARYCELVKDYIISTCLDDDLEIETAADYEIIYNAALCPQVSLDDIKQAISVTYGAKWSGKDLFDALENVEGGLGEYISTKVWETDLMIRLGETEAVYAERHIKERSRMIAALKIPQFFRILEDDRLAKEMKAKNG
jgi:hypothetical protein